MLSALVRILTKYFLFFYILKIRANPWLNISVNSVFSVAQKIRENLSNPWLTFAPQSAESAI